MRRRIPLNTPEIRVLLGDDHAVVRAGYRRLLETTDDITVIAEADSGEESYTKYFECHPNVLVMDISMPGIGGLEASLRILARDKAARILVFSVHENEVFLNRAIDSGILGYITKRSAPDVMIDAIRQVAAGEAYIGQDMMSHLVKRKTSPDSNLVAGLSPREFEVFHLLANSKSVNDIAEILNISPRTAGHHCTSVKKKLGVADIAALTRLAIRLGIITP
ncbi:MAG: response regulator [Xanthomonadales bacterium]|nr:response regulator [Xanthomonadales bacterium]